MLLYGASGHAKVIISCLRAQNIEINAIFDDDLSKNELWEIPVIGKYSAEQAPSLPLIISIGYNAIRKKVASSIEHRFGKVAHLTSIIKE